MKTPTLPVFLFPAILVLAILLSRSASAADATWNVNTAGSWATGSNWTPTAAPGVSDGGVTINNPDTATFGSIISATRIVTVDSNRNIFGINFAGNSSGYTLSGGSLLLSDGGIIQTSGGGSAHTDTVATAITLEGDGGAQSFTAGSTTATRILAISGGVTGVSTGSNVTTLTLNGTGTSNSNTVSGAISDGAGGGKIAVVKSGTGNWTLAGANTFTGGVTLTSGQINLNSAGALGTTGGTFAINGGTIDNTSGSAKSLLSASAYTGTFSNTSSTITMANTTGLVVGQFVYGTGVASGAYITAIVPNTTITVSTPATAGGTNANLTFGSLVGQTWGADYSFTGTANLNLGSGAISLGANAGATRTVTVGANTLTTGGTITNGTHGVTPTVNLLKNGAGTLAISGTNTLGYTGTTTVSAGTLSITGSNTYAGGFVVNGGTLLGRNPANTLFMSAFGSSLITLNSGTLQLRGNGNVDGSLLAAGNDVTTGAAAVTINVDRLDSVNNRQNNTFVFNNLTLGSGQLNVTGANNFGVRFTGTTTLSADTTFNPTTGNLGLTGVVSGGYSITKTGAGSLTLSGVNTYTGTTAVLGGTLSVGAAAPSGADGALGNSTTDVLIGDISGSVNTTFQSLVSTARNLRVQSGNTGTVTLNANGTGGGTFAISGNIILGTDNGTGHGVSLISGTGGNAQFTTANYSGVIQDPSGLVGAGGVVTLNGVGTVILSGTNTYTGGTFLNSGSLTINNTQALGLGSLTINSGTINQSVGSALVGVTSQTWAGNFGFSSGGGQPVNLGTSAVSLTGSRVITTNNVGVTVGGVISGAGFGLTLKGTGFSGSVNLNGLNTFSDGATVVGSTAAFTAFSGSASGFGTGQTRLTNSSNSRIGLNVDTTVESLTSGIGALSFTGGTGGTNGTQALVFTGGGGTGAAGTATISGGIITAVNITEYGTDYTSAPTISLSNPGGSGTVTSAFSSSSVALGNKTLTLAGTNVSPATYVGIISGAGGSLVKNGSGVQILAGANTYTGTTTVNQGTLLINGSTVAASAFTVNNAGTLGGSGTVNGTVTVSSGGTLSPGNSPGLLTQGATTLNGGGNYNWQIVDATGIAGAGFDSINLTTGSALTLNNSSGDTFKINLWSLSSIGPDVNGDATNFSNASDYSWTLISTDQTISSFSADKFTINVAAINGTNGFTNALAGGTFSVSLSLDQTDLVLNYTAVPEPSTWLLLAGTGTFFMIMRRRRRM